MHLFTPPVDLSLALLHSETDQCAATPASHFSQTHVGWMSENLWPLLEKVTPVVV